MFKFFQKLFKKTKKISEFEKFKIKKVAKKIYQLNLDLTDNKEIALKLTASQLKEVYSIDKNRFNSLYTNYLRN